jgi:hypothetical protein
MAGGGDVVGSCVQPTHAAIARVNVRMSFMKSKSHSASRGRAAVRSAQDWRLDGLERCICAQTASQSLESLAHFMKLSRA